MEIRTNMQGVCLLEWMEVRHLLEDCTIRKCSCTWVIHVVNQLKFVMLNVSQS